MYKSAIIKTSQKNMIAYVLVLYKKKGAKYSYFTKMGDMLELKLVKHSQLDKFFSGSRRNLS